LLTLYLLFHIINKVALSVIFWRCVDVRARYRCLCLGCKVVGFLIEPGLEIMYLIRVSKILAVRSLGVKFPNLTLGCEESGSTLVGRTVMARERRSKVRVIST
jgi:hypothetical protein